jgi:catechol 2,3-dioxygenase-like lactoylglutathione lyase family enzyme
MANDFYTGIQHVGIPTANLDATVDFYKKLGFEVIREEYLKDGDCRVRFLKLKNLVIETYDAKDAAMKAGAVDHIALDVNDIDAAWKFAAEKGFKVLHDEPVGLPFWSKGIKCFNIEGPNMEKIEFCQIL